jgi:hypothetical protein
MLGTQWEHNGNNINLAPQPSPKRKIKNHGFLGGHGVINFKLFFEWA